MHVTRVFWLGKGASTSSIPLYVKAINVSIAVILFSSIIFLCLVNLDYNWVWGLVWNKSHTLWVGWLNTLFISCITLVTSSGCGLILALLSRLPLLPIRYGVQTFVEIIRSLPLLVIILVVWYGFGGVFNIPNSYRFPAGIFILTLFESAYISEIIRSGIESVSQSQLEAARAVGFTQLQTYQYVIMPQCIRQILPPLAGQFVSLTKNSSLLFVISIPELSENAQELNSQTYGTLEVYLPMAVGYLIINLPISLFSRWLEHYFKYET